MTANFAVLTIRSCYIETYDKDNLVSVRGKIDLDEQLSWINKRKFSALSI